MQAVACGGWVDGTGVKCEVGGMGGGGVESAYQQEQITRKVGRLPTEAYILKASRLSHHTQPAETVSSYILCDRTRNERARMDSKPHHSTLPLPEQNPHRCCSLDTFSLFCDNITEPPRVRTRLQDRPSALPG